MRTPRSLIAPAALSFLALTGLGNVSLWAAPGPETLNAVDTQVYNLLRTLRDPAAPGPLIVAEQLEAQGSLALPGLFRVLDERRIPDPVAPDEPGQVLSDPQTTAVLKALDGLGRGLAYPAWKLYFQIEHNPETEEVSINTAAAITALGGFGLSQDLEQLWELLQLDLEPGASLPRGLRMTMESTLTSILVRDPSALPHLRSVWTSLPDGWFDSFARSIGKTRDAQGMKLILEMLNLATGHERVVASQVSMLGPSNDRSLNSQVVSCLLEMTESESNVDVQTAVLGLGFLEDTSAIPALIDLLDDPRGGINASASHALGELTGNSLHGSSSVWRRWYEGELKWAREELHLEVNRLRSPDATVVKTSLKVLSRHRLERHQLAEAVTGTLSSSNVSVRLLAVQVLGDLDSRWTYCSLVELLQDPAEMVRTASHATLQRLTGLRHGPTVEDWSLVEFP